jgi:hypothetical protein
VSDKVSHEAQKVISRVIVQDGRSYVDAARWCDEQAAKVAAPYKDAAAEIRRWLDKLERKP